MELLVQNRFRLTDLLLRAMTFVTPMADRVTFRYADVSVYGGNQPTGPYFRDPDEDGSYYVSFLVIERQVFLPGESLEAVQDALTADALPLFLDRLPVGTPWRVTEAREVFPPNYD